MKPSSFFRHAGAYGLCSFLVNAGGFLLLPLYTRCLDQAAFGILDIVGRLAETVSMCLLFGGLRQALLTFYRQSDTEEDRRRVATGTYLLLGGICLAGGALAMVLAPDLCGWLRRRMGLAEGSLTPGMIRLAFLTVLAEPFCLASLALMQARFWSGWYLLVSTVQLVLRVAACVALVAGLGWGVLGVVLGTSLTASLTALVLAACELRRGVVWPRPGQLWQMVCFALPFLPGSICYFLLHHGDRFLLMRHGPEAVGVYGLGYRLAQLVGAFSLAPLCQVWYAQLYQVARTPEAPLVFGRAFTRILAGYALVGLGLYLFLDEIILLLAGPSYLGAGPLVLPVLLGCFCQAMASLMDAAFYVTRRTGLKLLVTVAASLVMLGLYLLLIPTRGAQGAALATFGGFAFLALATWLATRRLFPVRYEPGRLLGLVLLCAAVLVAGSYVPAALWAAPLKAGLWLFAPLAAWQVGLISAAEKGYLAYLACRIYEQVLSCLSTLGYERRTKVGGALAEGPSSTAA